MEIIKLNLIPSGVNPTCHCSQYDKGRVIRIELFDGLTPYTLKNGDTVTLNVRKPDNTIVTASLTATQGNTYVDIVTTEQMCAVVGYNLCDLTITNGSVVIGTLNFIMQVERDVLADGIPSQSDIEDLNARVQEAVGDNYYTKTEVDAEISPLEDQLNNKVDLPDITQPVSFTKNAGWVNRIDLSIYSVNNCFNTSIAVNEGEKYLISGWSQNNTYPCAFGVIENGTTAYIPLFAGGYSVSYSDYEITIPATVKTLYVNSDTDHPLNIKKVVQMTQAQAANNIVNALNTRLKAVYDGTKLLFKKKYNNTCDLVIRMNNDGGNNLFTFVSMYLAENTESKLNDNFAASDIYTASLSMRQSDWFGPYQVAADQNGDGDHPTSVYFTGGNHRSNNQATGGGVTATQLSLAVKFDGITPELNKIYDVDCIDLKWVNAVQAYNTSKDNGSGRAVLNETWQAHITADKVDVQNDILALEDITIKTYYGLQAYVSGWNCIFIGGSDRTKALISANRTSGNKTCRTINALNDNFSIKMHVKAEDLGSFENSPYSCFTNNNKMYFNLINGTNVNVLQNEHYYVKGHYQFE